MIDGCTCLARMHDALRRVEEYTRDGRDAFLASPMTQDAVVWNLEVISGVAEHLRRELRDATPDVPWARLIDLGDGLRHAYFSVPLDIVWGVVEQELPRLRGKVEALLQGAPPGSAAAPKP